MDPILATLVQTALATLVAVPALHKLRDPAVFRAALAAYRLVPAPLLPVVAVGLVGAECASAVALLLPPTARFGLAATVGLLTLYAGAITINLARGRRDIDCGCSGRAARQPIHWGLVVRNLLLAAIAGLALALPPAPRSLEWIDAVTLAGGVLTLAGLYHAADRLLAEGPRLRSLQGDA